MKTYSYAPGAVHEFMQKLSFDLKVPLQNDKVEIPEFIGKGFIKSIILEDNCCIRYYNVFLKDDIHYTWFADTRSEEPIFKLVFSIDHQNPVITSRAQGETNTPHTENSATLYSTDFSRAGVARQGRWIKRLILIFTCSWLKRNFNEANERIACLLDLLANRNMPCCISEVISFEQQQLIKQLADKMSHDEFPLLHARAMSLFAINNFLDSIVKSNAQTAVQPQAAVCSQIAEVERSISQYFDRQMPNICELAQRFNMSSATLKRHFKTSYGKSIYQYYLEKKMAMGKTLICEDHKSVSEVAYTLGYNKINSFSRVFKKHYGILPRDLGSHRFTAL